MDNSFSDILRHESQPSDNIEFKKACCNLYLSIDASTKSDSEFNHHLITIYDSIKKFVQKINNFHSHSKYIDSDILIQYQIIPNLFKLLEIRDDLDPSLVKEVLIALDRILINIHPKDENILFWQNSSLFSSLIALFQSFIIENDFSKDLPFQLQEVAKHFFILIGHLSDNHQQLFSFIPADIFPGICNIVDDYFQTTSSLSLSALLFLYYFYGILSRENLSLIIQIIDTFINCINYVFSNDQYFSSKSSQNSNIIDNNENNYAKIEDFALSGLYKIFTHFAIDNQEIIYIFIKNSYLEIICNIFSLPLFEPKPENSSENIDINSRVEHLYNIAIHLIGRIFTTFNPNKELQVSQIIIGKSDETIKEEFLKMYQNLYQRILDVFPQFFNSISNTIVSTAIFQFGEVLTSNSLNNSDDDLFHYIQFLFSKIENNSAEIIKTIYCTASKVISKMPQQFFQTLFTNPNLKDPFISLLQNIFPILIEPRDIVNFLQLMNAIINASFLEGWNEMLLRVLNELDFLLHLDELMEIDYQFPDEILKLYNTIHDFFP